MVLTCKRKRDSAASEPSVVWVLGREGEEGGSGEDRRVRGSAVETPSSAIGSAVEKATELNGLFVLGDEAFSWR